MKEAQFARLERRARVVTARLAGQTTQEVSQRHGIPLRSVHHIIATTPGASEELERRAQEARAAKRDAAFRWSHRHVGVPLTEGAAELGLPETSLRRILGNRAPLHPNQRSGQLRYTDEEILQRIREWVATHGSSMTAYRTAAPATPGWPSLTTIASRFGTWTQALRAAGFTTGPGHGPPRRWTRDRVAVVVADYFAESSSWSLKGLGTWLDADSSRPSLATVYLRLGPWSELTKLATRAE